MKRSTRLTTWLRDRRRLIENVFSLYSLQIASFVFPLITVPYLARTLGPSDWGLVVFAQALAFYITLLLEYGFGFSATRDIARAQDDVQERIGVLTKVNSARLVMAAGILPLGFIVATTVSPLRNHTSLVCSMLFSAWAQGLNLVWYFQGIERLKLLAGLELGSRILSAALIITLVSGPQDSWLVLFATGTGSTVVLLFSALVVRRDLGRFPLRVEPRAAAEGLRSGWGMFIFRNSLTFYTTANTLILGFIAPPRVVGLFGGAEKLLRALTSLTNPVSQALYPRLNVVMRRSRHRAAEITTKVLWVLSIIGLIQAFGLILLSTALVRLALGEEFGSASDILRILAIVAPLSAFNGVLAIQWLAPLGLEAKFSLVTAAGAVVNLVLALLLVPLWGGPGMAFAVVTAEATTTILTLAFLKSRSLLPWALPSNQQARPELEV